MNDAWIALTKYKFLADRIKELKKRAWSELPYEADVEVSIREAEEELAKLRTWIEMNYEMKRVD